MNDSNCASRRRRHVLHLALGTGGAMSALSTCWLPARAQSRTAIRRLGIFSLLGDSVRIVARETREALFKDIGMDKLTFDAVGGAVLASQAQTELRHFRAPIEVDVSDQVSIGVAAGWRAELPTWVANEARDAALSHVLLVTSSVGAMEFKTGMSQVVGNNRVMGIGFMVSATGRFKDSQTGHVANGYLAPFVQLRLTLIDLAGPRVVHSASLSEGFVVGPHTNEAPDPWLFLSRQEKAGALDGLLRRVIARGMQEVLAAV